MKLRLVKQNETFCVFFNEVFVGQFYQEVDGYYVYTSNKNDGFVDAVFLRALADKLDEINKPWHDEVVKLLKWKPLTLTKEQMEKIVGEAQKLECEHKDCSCRACWSARNDGRAAVTVGSALVNPIGMPFIVCPVCGNKRCPKASDHNNACTGSNEPGQAGSLY